MSIPETWTRENDWECPQCGASVPFDAKQCEECGYTPEPDEERQ